MLGRSLRRRKVPKIAKALSAIEVKRIKKPGLHAIGEVPGLQMQVTKTGARSWILRATVGGTRRDIGLGSYPEVTLAMARDAARNARAKIRDGVDVVAERQAARRHLITQQAHLMTFAEAARAKHAAISLGFRNAKHAKQWISTLETYAFPLLGGIDVSEIELSHVVDVLKPLWVAKTETASRLRGRIEAVLDWATVTGHRHGANPARWKGNLQQVFPKPSKVATPVHHPALPWKSVPEFMADLRRRRGSGARALELAILTAARSKEVREARWAEFDLDNAQWTVPRLHMKGNLVHRVPLSNAALAVLLAQPRMAAGEYVFASRQGGSISDMTLNKVMKLMHAANLEAGGVGYMDPEEGRRAVPHGFRSSFKDWARATSRYPDEVSELALAHVNSGKTRAAYARDELYEPRAAQMNDWACFCAGGAAA